MMSVARLSAEHLVAEHLNSGPKRAKVEIQPVLSFLDEDKIGTIQSHDDALVLTLKIGGYDIKRILVDQGSSAEIMYLDLYKGLNLIDEDLTAYNSPFGPKYQIEPRSCLDPQATYLGKIDTF